ncbi:MAG: hypothetical protein FWG84_01760 [Bacteroidales bacterium]|nr:hypothetical protein [Bacteroidales bacterium]
MKVIVLSEVLEYFEDLVVILYEREYFGFEDTALKYVIELYDDIVATLPTRLHKPAPAYFDRYGKNMKYAAFRKNKSTTWYAFFTTYWENGKTIYLVRYVANNHTIAQYL